MWVFWRPQPAGTRQYGKCYTMYHRWAFRLIGCMCVVPHLLVAGKFTDGSIGIFFTLGYQVPDLDPNLFWQVITLAEMSLWKIF